MLEGPNIIRSTAGEASWTPITDDGRGGASEPVDLSQDDKDDDIVVELHTDVGQVAKAVVKIADIWAVGALSQRPAHWNIGSAIVRLARRHEMSRRGTCNLRMLDYRCIIARKAAWHWHREGMRRTM